ncbi:MAG TPA: prepilin peptidase [Bacilli bacterium]|nr:prepilin peptidase [Bacilli bacterium]
MEYFLIFIFGLLFGSFYLVVATRLPNNKSIVKPRSHCDNCHKQLKWYELIPVFSYIFLRGRCSKCHKKISILNPLMELLTAFLFTLSYYLYGFSYEFAISLIVSSVLVITFISDFKYYIILDSPIIIGSVGLLIIYFINYSFIDVLYKIGEGLIVFLIVFIIKLIGDKVFKRESLGGGDVKLMIFVGLLLGLKLGVIAFSLGAFLALPYALYMTKKVKEKEVPFGPFIILAAFLTFIFQTDIINILNNFLF